MKRLVVFGAGQIGAAAAEMLARTRDYRVMVVDRDATRLASLKQAAPVEVEAADASDPVVTRRILAGAYAALSAAPYNLTIAIAEAAAAVGAHHLDLTEDVASTRRVKELAANARTAFIPQCGLAPGFISMAAFDLARRFDAVDTIRMRVGALPQNPTNALGYNLTWSTDGVINEYIEPCEAIIDGRLRELPALEGLEHLAIDGVAYEAFNTSGGLGTLAETLKGRVRNLDYKTIRYPGHAAIMKLLLQDLRLRDRRPLLKEILEGAIPATDQDVVLAFVSATGSRGGRFMEQTIAVRVEADEIEGRRRSAIQITTASALCAVLDLLADGQLPGAGLIRQEDIPFDAFLNNRFGSVYRRGLLADHGGRDAPPMRAVA